MEPDTERQEWEEKAIRRIENVDGKTGDFSQDHRTCIAGAFAGVAGEERKHSLVIQKVTATVRTREPEVTICDVSIVGDWTCDIKEFKGFPNECTERVAGAKVTITLTAFLSHDILLFRDMAMTQNDW
eukprot:CAMPEP_0184696246 /NCGR_PEP_ID=MMETSP0313-20130426/3603_1 /TAXON_ID=2792 /ORGANISM="Porphyridium aerugineum, Strain SAG 1380-2" /LENGTH=127 /DNA_ID=CAMNT_0027154831 /DNA_START=116 /DNA_END=496 /DNA_ORIENTATION=+